MSHWINAEIPKNICFFAIGDKHGYSAALRRMYQEIDNSIHFLPSETLIEIIDLGDHVDRGPDSKGIIQIQIDQQKKKDPRIARTFLLANHDILPRAALEEKLKPRQIVWWFNPAVGGMETLRSYTPNDPSAIDDLPRWVKRMQQKFPEHTQFLQEQKLFHQIGEYLFVHAGINPQKSWQEQLGACQSIDDLLKVDNDTLLWVRKGFLDYQQDELPAHALPENAKVVIHGHTISKKIGTCGNQEIIIPSCHARDPITEVDTDVLQPWRLGIDTGIYKKPDEGAGLTCFWRCGKDHGFIRVSQDGQRVIHYKMNALGQIIPQSIHSMPYNPL